MTSIKVIPNVELYRLLFPFGSNVEVISPLHVKKQLAQPVQKMFEIYCE